jgi:UDP-GlcNAc:undecaprenyl-phosphate/decaprenyl-phosphate GlcNAc-1-phosphate transferase
MPWLLEISPFLLTFLLALGSALGLVPVARWLSYRWGVVSKPGGRRLERQPMPKLGSVVLFGSFTLTIIVAQYLPIERQDPQEIVRLVGLLVGSTFIFGVGLLDDFFELNFFWQAVGQIVGASIAIFFQIFIEYFNNPFTGQATEAWGFVVTVTLTMFWLGLMMNTVNFLDGSDGLATGVALIAGVLLFVNSVFFVQPAQLSVSLLPLALVGTCVGFLLYNFPPAQIYLGGGALYLGYLLGTLSIIGGAKMATILLVMGLPLMDLAWQAFNRLRQGRNPFSGDRGHIHFRLLDSGRVTPRQLAIGYYGFCAFFGVLTLVLESQLYKFLAFGVMLLIIGVAFVMVTRLKNQSSSESP